MSSPVACFSDGVATGHAHLETLEIWVSLISHVKTSIATTRKGVYLSTVAASAAEQNLSTFLGRKTPAGEEGRGEEGGEGRALKVQCGVAESQKALRCKRHKQMTGGIRHHRWKLWFILLFLNTNSTNPSFFLFSSTALNIQHVNLEKLENLHRHRTQDFTASRALVVRRGAPFRISLQLAGRPFNPSMDKLRIKVMLGNQFISLIGHVYGAWCWLIIRYFTEL